MKQQNKIALSILMLNTFITMAGIGLIIPIMPQFLRGFGSADTVGTALGFIIATFSFAQFLFSPISGRLSDKHGRKKIILIGLLIYAASQLAFSLSTQLWMLYVARFFSGFGAAFLIPPMMAFVADITPFESRGKGMGMLGAAITLGFVVGPALGGFLASITLLFPLYFATGATLVAFILSIFFLPNIKPSEEQLEQAKVRVSLGQQLKQSTKENYFVLLLVMLIFSFGLANFQSTLSLFLDKVFSYGAKEIAIVITIGGFAGVIMQSFFIQKLFERFGEMRIILINLLIAGISMMGILFVHQFWSIALVAAIFFTATSLLRPAVNTFVSKLASKSRQGYAAGMMNSYMSFGNMFGPATAGLLFDWNISAPYIVGMTALIIGYAITKTWSIRNTELVQMTSSQKKQNALS
ncbi:MFS transporter [Savagea sp. SN6]|uniref:MFS transporter n=1 Tax=Savagea serpentis TaxID=2785297 RepID=A0A8J7G9M4_9BACL|nr:MFS transporter [Savagea serpentis]MBF4501768.1 MFS transporter [Savagea serpentis]